MQLQIFSTHDSKSGLFSPPFYKLNQAVAERDFKSIVNDPQSTINKYPQDFNLYTLGEFDDNTGKMELLPAPLHVIQAIALVDQKQ